MPCRCVASDARPAIRPSCVSSGVICVATTMASANRRSVPDDVSLEVGGEAERRRRRWVGNGHLPDDTVGVAAQRGVGGDCLDREVAGPAGWNGETDAGGGWQGAGAHARAVVDDTFEAVVEDDVPRAYLVDGRMPATYVVTLAVPRGRPPRRRLPVGVWRWTPAGTRRGRGRRCRTAAPKRCRPAGGWSSRLSHGRWSSSGCTGRQRRAWRSSPRRRGPRRGRWSCPRRGPSARWCSRRHVSRGRARCGRRYHAAP